MKILKTTNKPSHSSMIFRILPLVLIVGLFPVPSLGHSIVRYVLTPTTPSKELQWWLPFACAILVVGSFLIIWRINHRNWKVAACLAPITVLLYAILISFSTLLTDGRPSGIGFPYPTFWGISWDQAAGKFIGWNIFGYAIFVAAIFLCSIKTKAKARPVLTMLSAAVLYATTLTPYIYQGAFLHGWTGGYVYNDCVKRLEIINNSLIDHAIAKDGLLPDADNMNALLALLDVEYNQKDLLFDEISLEYCPVGSLFER